MTTSDHRSIVVIGGSGGIGRAIALELAAPGVDLVVAGRDLAACAEVVALAQGRGARARAAAIDLTDDASVRSLFGDVALAPGRLDLLVNAAGQAFLGGSATTSPEMLSRMIDVNLIGVYRAVHAARELLAAAGGHVINVISRAGRQPYANAIAYGTAKAGLVYLTRALSLDLRDAGVRVNAVSPGAVDTPMRRRLVPGEDPGSLLAPEQVARVVAALSGPQSAIVNGACIDVPW